MTSGVPVAHQARQAHVQWSFQPVLQACLGGAGFWRPPVDRTSIIVTFISVAESALTAVFAGLALNVVFVAAAVAGHAIGEVADAFLHVPAADVAHADITRLDSTMVRAFGWGKAAGHKAIVRLFQRSDQPSATRVQASSYRWLFDKLQLKPHRAGCGLHGTDPRGQPDRRWRQGCLGPCVSYEMAQIIISA